MFKLAVTAGTHSASPQALVVFRGLDESAPVAKELGYGGLEIAVAAREDLDSRSLRLLLARYELDVPVFSTGQMSRVLGLHFSDPDPDTRNRAVDVFKGIVDLAGEFGADVNVSLVRGWLPDGGDPKEALGWVTACLEAACRRAERHGSRLLLEQMNRYETNYLNSAAEVGEYIRAIGIPNLKLHADTFHMNIEDRDIPGTLEEYRSELGYVHFADSNRLAPGSGHLDFAGVVGALARIGYTGWVGLEVLRVPNAIQAAKSSIEYLRGLSTIEA